MKIKDAVVDFFHNQGITIVTIQPEFNTKTTPDKKGSGSLSECLIGCQSLECAPKTCCSTNDLHTILSNGGEEKKLKLKKPKSERKSGSLLSLNIASLTKLRKMTGSTPDIIKKSVSESHVTQIGQDDSGDSQNTSTNVSTTILAANNLHTIHDSIDELGEKEFHEQCDERSEQRLPSDKRLSQQQQSDSNGEHEDSSLLNKPSSPESKPAVDTKCEEQPPQEQP